MNRRQFLALSSLATAQTLVSCRSGVPKASVVLVVLDTVRARTCSAWAFHRPTTPALERLATHATRYAHAIAPAPWTLSSHASMFTGAYAGAHGARGFPYRDPDGTLRMHDAPLKDEYLTLAERLKASGYATAMFSANTGYLAPWFNLDQGFDTYDVRYEPGVDLADRALGWIDTQSAAPFFLVCNLMDAHGPYNTEPLDSLPDPVSRDTNLLLELREKTLGNTGPLDTTLAGAVRAQYELGVAHADRGVGHLLDGLKQRGLYDDVLVIVTSDHGEFLGEHMLVEHSKDLYEETSHVPLLVKVPGQKNPRVEKGTRSLVQLPATVLYWTGAGSVENLPPALDDGAPFPILAENHYSRDWDVKDPRWSERFDRIRSALYDGDWKYIWSSDGAHELYNLDADPAESNNRITVNAEVARRLHRTWERATASFNYTGEQIPPAVTAPEGPTGETEESLRSLGYL